MSVKAQQGPFSSSYKPSQKGRHHSMTVWERNTPSCFHSSVRSQPSYPAHRWSESTAISPEGIWKSAQHTRKKASLKQQDCDTVSHCFILFVFGGPCHLPTSNSVWGPYFPPRTACLFSYVRIIASLILMRQWGNCNININMASLILMRPCLCKYYSSVLEFLPHNYIVPLKFTCGCIQKTITGDLYVLGL